MTFLVRIRHLPVGWAAVDVVLGFAAPQSRLNKMGTREDRSNQDVVVLGLVEPQVDLTKWGLTNHSDNHREVQELVDVPHDEEVGIEQTEAQWLEDADVLDSDSGVLAARTRTRRNRTSVVVESTPGIASLPRKLRALTALRLQEIATS